MTCVFWLDTLRGTHDHAPMSRRSRGDLLLDRIGSDGRVSVGGLARDLGVTPSTIRRDLARLARDGRIVRTYGGAELRGTSLPDVADSAVGREGRDRRYRRRARPRRRDDPDLERLDHARVRPAPRRSPPDRHHERPGRGDRPHGSPRYRAGRPRGGRPGGDALDAGPHRRAGPPRTAGGRAVHGHRGDRAGSRPDERLDPRDPDGSALSGAPRATASSSRTRPSSTRSPRPSCSTSTRSRP